MQWKQGDAIPISWRNHYKYNPCVPVDYSTVHAALGVVDVMRNDPRPQTNTVRVLLRPGRYILREAITIDTEVRSWVGGEDAPIDIELATQELFPTIFHPTAMEAARNASVSPTEQEPSKKRKKTLRNLLSCRSVDAAEEEPAAMMVEHPFGGGGMDVDMVHGGGDIPADMLLENHPLGGDGNSTTSSSTSTSSSTVSPKIHRASLILRTRRHNEPLLRIRQGSCTVRNIDLKHICHGTGKFSSSSSSR